MRDIKLVKNEIDKQLSLSPETLSVVNLVDFIIEYAYTSKSSDVHIHPQDDGVRIRFRVDGLLRDVFPKEKISKDLHHEIISRIKVISGLRTDEHNMPQDGRFRVKLESMEEVDVRVSIMPTYYGENAVMRILAETHGFAMKDLGFGEVDMGRMNHAIKKPYGMILAAGPTSSGKTTTLYTMLKELNKPEASIITIEDPIEYSLEGTTQIQVEDKTGLTFASGLRSILRQDPNIVMVGEIRDEETAAIAVNAALTGHLVLSTLHTNNAATTFPRLIDMGVQPFLVASTVNIAVGQRLVRKICGNCKKERILTAGESATLSEVFPKEELAKNERFYRGTGCDVCSGSGYEGRIGIREVLEVTNDIRQLIIQRASSQDIEETAVRAGMTTMLMDGFKKALAGLTTLEEVLRIIHE